MSKSKLVDTIGQFTTVPNSVVLMIGTIGADAFALFSYFRYRGGTSGEIFPSYDDIKKNTGLSRERIANAIRSLEENQLLEKRRRFGASTIYILKLPTPISRTGGLMENEPPESSDPLVGQSDSISRTGGLSLVGQSDTNKTPLTRINQQEKDSPNGNPPVVSPGIKDLEYLETLFAQERGVPLPDWGKDEPDKQKADKKARAAQSTWRTPLKTILSQCHSLEEAEEVVMAAIKHMQDDRLTFTKPVQILETALSVKADRRNGKARIDPDNPPYIEIY